MSTDLTRLQGAPTPGEIAGRTTDPRFFWALSVLPNPDTILRRLGRSEEIYDAIQSDAHVIGELRAIKADLQRFPHSLQPGGERRIDKRAHELCQAVLDRDPAPLTSWQDVFWNIAQSTFRGLSVQEIVWEVRDGLYLPARIEDRPKRRFQFDGHGQLRFLTRSNLMPGELADEKYFLVDRHMPSYDNPYGVALLSSCFWPYTFKHGGFRWFVKFCERFGIPFPVGKYPVGASEDVVDKLEGALEALIEAGYAAIEEGGDISLIETKGGGTGKLAQHQLIEVCNAEMSKALTSQTLATEQTSGNGARAASQTHAERSSGINDGDRTRISATLNKLWALITVVNFGRDAKAPKSDFIGDAQGTLDRAQVYEKFHQMGGNPSRKAMAEDLGIELADDADPADQMTPKPAAPPIPPAPPGSTSPAPVTFSKFTPAESAFPDQAALDQAIDALRAKDASALLAPLLKPVFEFAQAHPDALIGRLAELYPDLDSTALYERLANAMFVADAWGRLTAGIDRAQGR